RLGGQASARRPAAELSAAAKKAAVTRKRRASL
ncbi:MAG: plasmid stabilization protein, partial [Pseudomonadota bacterium]|nr:plasmid stabilization protein [Pseudomonadota bacterium]MDQ6703143.1 plasmid stabilization protein [Pseudomonadota bacterium]